jgi:hypothetical protein
MPVAQATSSAALISTPADTIVQVGVATKNALRVIRAFSFAGVGYGWAGVVEAGKRAGGGNANWRHLFSPFGSYLKTKTVWGNKTNKKKRKSETFLVQTYFRRSI